MKASEARAMSGTGVYQEATAPARGQAIVLCGKHQAGLEDILVINQLIRQHTAGVTEQHEVLPDWVTTLLLSATDIDNGRSLSGVRQIYAVLRRRYHATGRSRFLRLADLLPTLRDFHAPSPHDKLFALVPTSLNGLELLDVDYNLLVEDVYTNDAWALV